MKNLILSLSFFISFLSIATCVQAQEKLTWHTDLVQAQEISNKTKKPIFGFFTGSDWCGWCTKLQNEVFAKPEFVAWAKKNVVLLELDFPRRKEMSEATKKQNSELQQAFKVQGYPTVWLFYVNNNNTTNAKGLEALGSLGYPAGATPGKEEVKFISEANTILALDKNKAKAKKKKISKRKKK